jgi:hypothetical protein
LFFDFGRNAAAKSGKQSAQRMMIAPRALPFAKVLKDRALVKCHAGCTIDAVLSALGMTQRDLFPATHPQPSGTSSTPSRSPRLKVKQTNEQPFDWRACSDALTDKHVETLAKWRGYSPAFVRELKEKGLIGIYDGLVGFPVVNDGKIVGVHYRLKPKNGDKADWLYAPTGINAAPMVFGEIAEGDTVHVFESQWDMFAFADCSGEKNGLIATRGASNGALVAGLIPENSTVYIWPQNDPPGQKWAKDVCAHAEKSCTIKLAKTPAQHGDLNCWTNAGASSDDLLQAVVLAETASLVQQSDEAAIRGKIVRILTNRKLSDFEQREKISKVVVPALLARGRFFYHIDKRDLKSAMFFDNERKRLERIRSDWFQVWLSDWLSINKIEMPFKAAASAVEAAALTESISTGITPESFWATRPGLIYLSNGDAAMVKIAARGKVELVDNGTDNVLFARGDTLAPWKLTQPQDPFDTCSVFKDANCAAEHGPDLLRLWILSLASNPHKKPPLCLTGEVGSGKTRLAEGIAELYGLPFIANNVSDDFGDKDFWVSVDAGGLCTLDNCDTRIKWLADAVAAHATAGHRDKRKLYTDSEKVTLHARAWLCLTTANPTFASDAGLADRLLVVRMNRRNDETADSKLSKEITQNRDAGLSFIAQTLAEALKDNKPVPAGLNLRHPDFATFAVKIGRAIGCEPQAINAITVAEKDKSLFCLENDFVASALLDYVNTAKSFTGTAAELREKLIEADPSFITRDGKPSVKTIGKRLSTLCPHLERVLPVARVETGRGRLKTYTLGRETDHR